MSKLLILYNYNKYYNRIIKRKSSFQEYKDLITPVGDTPAAFKGFIRENMNFDYQDGVYAQHVINISKADPQYAKIEHPDYCILEETYVQGEGDSAITTKKISRYFILDVQKIRGNQFLYSLRRDLLADYYDNVLNAPVFIEKGWVSSLDDPAIFNKESMTFNQIKQGEILLNQTKLSGKGQGWVVGYIAKDQRKTAIGPCEGKAEPPTEFLDYDNDLPTDIKNALTRGFLYHCNKYEVRFLVDSQWSSGGGLPVDEAYGLYIRGGLLSDLTYFANVFGGNGAYAFIRRMKTWDANAIKNSFYYAYQYANLHYNIDLYTKFQTWLENNKPADTSFTNYQNFNGKIYEKDGVYYRLKIHTPEGGPNNPNIPAGESYEKVLRAEYTASQLLSGSDAIAIDAKHLIDAIPANSNGMFVAKDPQINGKTFLIDSRANFYFVESEIVQYDTVSATISANRNENFDGPYDVFCMPLGEIGVYNNSTLVFNTSANVSIPMARGIAITGTSAKIYDIQILPYCPFDEILNSDGDIELSGFTEHYDFDYVIKTVEGITSNVGIILYPKGCKGTFDITLPNTEPLYDYLVENREYVISKKLRSETNLIRFVSPNFASQFEINAQKNKGITNINVDYFYKPYSPYIHVAPYFNGFYGQDFNDPKGLICSGDFSIATASSKWEEYQIQNKNYELTFDRQIENLDVNNSIAYSQAALSSGIGVATSTLTGVAVGAATGAKIGSLGGPVGTLVGAGVGALIGGVAGGTISGVGRTYDLDYLKQQQSEARSYAVDMYAYSLGNIKALPYTLTKVSAFTPNNKIFPFIEIYDCTDEEKATLTAKLRYNGMTIMRIGRIADFLGEYFYVSGQLIRLTGIDEDSHVVAEIAKEIKEGAYYYGSDSE